jgi:acyl carrier protein phosphodiesterase
MNFLAHLYFAENNAHCMLGSLMGDFVKGKQINNYPEDVRTGITKHRLIDKYTDSHPVVKQSKQRISAERRRFSGIMIDVFYDYFLANNWAMFSSEDLDQFINNCYDNLSQQTAFPLPGNLNGFIQQMSAENTLRSYGTLEGIDKTINRLSRRIRFKNTLHGGMSELIDNELLLEEDFLSFFPDLIQYTKTLSI